MMLKAVIDRTRNLVMTGKQDRINVLNANVGSDATSVTLSYESGPVNAGSVLSIGTEDYYVLETAGDTAGTPITVIPGHNGSTSISHTAGDLVRINPRFSDNDIWRSLDEGLKDMVGQGCFYVKDIEIDFNPSVQGYAFTADDFLQPYRVRYDVPGPSKFWPPLKPTDYYIDIHANTTDFPSGKQLVLRRGGHSGHKVRMAYKARFGDVLALALADDLDLVGLHDEGQPVLPYCAATFCMAGQEIKRNFGVSQPEPRRQDEVPAGAMRGAMEPLARLYYQKLEIYKTFLHRLYPMQVGP